MAGLILLTLLAAPPWERAPTPAEVVELRLRLAPLGGRSAEAGGVETMYASPRALAALPPLRFRCAVSLTGVAADADLDVLARHPGVVDLSLVDAKISDAGVRKLAALPGLARLSLAHATLNNAGLAALPPLPGLRRLNLVGTNVSDAGIAHLAGRKLLRLEIPQAARTDLGLKHTLNAVERFESFDSQYDWPHVTDTGLAALAGRESLRTLVWAGRLLGPTLRRVLPTLRGLRTLHLEGAEATDDDLKPLGSLRELVALNVAGWKVTDAGLRHLAGLGRLDQLNLSRTPVTAAGMREVARLPRLRELYLMDTAAGDAELKPLAAAPELRRLHLERTQVTADGLRAFAGRKLAHVHGGDHLRSEGVFLILFPNLPVGDTDFGGWPLTDVGLERVLTRRDATRLSIRGEFSPKALGKLAALPKLDHLSVQGTLKADALRELSACKGLTGLSLEAWNYLPAEGLTHLAKLEKLEYLGLDNCMLDTMAIAALADFKRLKTLSFRTGRVPERAILLLAGVKTLKLIDITHAGVSEAARTEFAKLRPDCKLYEGD